MTSSAPSQFEGRTGDTPRLRFRLGQPSFAAILQQQSSEHPITFALLPVPSQP
jgi:hypothetical protein